MKTLEAEHVAVDPVPASTRREGRSRGAIGVLIVVLFAIGVFHLATIREGHGWLDDFASYVGHAKNIAEGHAYEDTGYLYNPDAPVAGPRAYPPEYSVVLAPVYALRGFDLEAMKVMGVGFLVAFLAAAYALIRRWHPPAVAVVAIALVGFDPFISSFKDNILSDIPYAFFMMLALLAMTRDPKDEAPWKTALLIGLASYAAYATRSIGIILVPVFVVYSLTWKRTARPVAFRSAAITGLLVGLHSLLLSGGSGYLDQLRLSSVRLTAVNLWRYVRSLEGLTVNGYWHTGGVLLFLALTLLALVGYLAMLRRDRRTIIELVVPAYVLAIAVWPSFQSLRFLIPLLPFYFMYAICGARIGARLLPRPRLALGLAAGVMAISFLGVYSRLDYGPLPEGVAAPPTVEMFSFIRAETQPGSVILFQRPKALALYTDRTSTPYPAGWTDEQIDAYISSTGVTYLVDADFDGGRLAAYARSNPDRVRVAFANEAHSVWEIAQVPGTP